jgi:hypothetical protein
MKEARAMQTNGRANQREDSRRTPVVFVGLPPLRTDEEGYPVVDSYRVLGDGAEVVNVVFWCRYCLRWHYHGAGNGQPGDGDGHRVAHCINRTSLYLTGDRHGYILEDVGTITAREMREYERAAKRQACTETCRSKGVTRE